MSESLGSPLDDVPSELNINNSELLRSTTDSVPIVEVPQESVLPVEDPSSEAMGSAVFDPAGASSFLSLLSSGVSVFRESGHTLAEQIALCCAWPISERYVALDFLAARGIGLLHVHLCAMRGDLQAVLTEVEKGNLLLTDSQDNTVITYLCAHGHINILSELYSRCPYLCVKTNKEGSTPLLFAVQNGHFLIAEWLMEHAGAQIPAKIEGGSFALYLAGWNGHVETAKWLVGKGADVEQRTENGETTLMCAAKRGHLDLVRYLVTEGNAKVDAVNENRTALLNACYRGYLDVVKCLVQEGKATVPGSCSLIAAAHSGCLKLARFLVDNGSQVGEVAQEGKVGWLLSLEITALLQAVRDGHLELAQWLICNGANINERDHGGSPLLLRAVGSVAMVKWLVQECGVAVSEPNETTGETALISAAYEGQLEAVKWLLREGGAQQNEKTRSGCTALLAALRENQAHVVTSWHVDFGFSFADALPRYRNIAKGDCFHLCDIRGLFDAVAVDYHIRQHIDVVRCVAREILQTSNLLPTALQNIITDYAARHDRELKDLHDTIFKKHFSILSQQKGFHPGFWDITQDVVNNLVHHIVGDQPSTILSLYSLLQRYKKDNIVMVTQQKCVNRTLDEVVSELSSLLVKRDTENDDNNVKKKRKL